MAANYEMTKQDIDDEYLIIPEGYCAYCRRPSDGLTPCCSTIHNPKYTKWIATEPRLKLETVKRLKTKVRLIELNKEKKKQEEEQKAKKKADKKRAKRQRQKKNRIREALQEDEYTV